MNSNILPELSRERREFVKLSKNKLKLHRIQLCTRYVDNDYVYGRVMCMVGLRV